MHHYKLLIASEIWTDALHCGLTVDVIYFDFKSI